MRRLLLTTVVATLAVGIVPTAARADAPRDQGWWTVTNPVPAPPDVPARGLLVQGGGSTPAAIAAVLYELSPGSTASTLTLSVAPNSLTTPAATLQLCPLLQPINHPEQGGPMSDAPPYNCAKKVTAAPGSDGKSYQFGVSALVTDNLVAVAILPTGPVDRVVLAAPDAKSLTTQPGTGDAGSSSPDSSVGSSSDTAAVPLPDVTSGLVGTGGSPNLAASLPGAVATGPSSVSPPPVAAAPRGLPNAGGIFVPALSTRPAKATPILVVLFVAGALGGAALWLYSGRHRDNAAVVS